MTWDFWCIVDKYANVTHVPHGNNFDLIWEDEFQTMSVACISLQCEMSFVICLNLTDNFDGLT